MTLSLQDKITSIEMSEHNQYLIATDGEPDDMFTLLSLFLKATQVHQSTGIFPIKGIIAGGFYPEFQVARMEVFLAKLHETGLIPTDVNLSIEPGAASPDPENEKNLNLGLLEFGKDKAKEMRLDAKKKHDAIQIPKAIEIFEAESVFKSSDAEKHKLIKKAILLGAKQAEKEKIAKDIRDIAAVYANKASLANNIESSSEVAQITLEFMEQNPNPVLICIQPLFEMIAAQSLYEDRFKAAAQKSTALVYGGFNILQCYDFDTNNDIKNADAIIALLKSFKNTVMVEGYPLLGRLNSLTTKTLPKTIQALSNVDVPIFKFLKTFIREWNEPLASKQASKIKDAFTENGFCPFEEVLTFNWSNSTKAAFTEKTNTLKDAVEKATINFDAYLIWSKITSLPEEDALKFGYIKELMKKDPTATLSSLLEKAKATLTEDLKAAQVEVEIIENLQNTTIATHNDVLAKSLANRYKRFEHTSRAFSIWTNVAPNVDSQIVLADPIIAALVTGCAELSSFFVPHVLSGIVKNYLKADKVEAESGYYASKFDLGLMETNKDYKAEVESDRVKILGCLENHFSRQLDDVAHIFLTKSPEKVSFTGQSVEVDDKSLEDNSKPSKPVLTP